MTPMYDFNTLDLDGMLANTNVEPRPYQRRIVKRTLDSFYDKGLRSVLIESPTGSGKTIMALMGIKMMQRQEPGLRVGWVSMRRNLLNQAAQENETKGINADVTFISMFDRNPPTGFDMLVVDEAQHDAADSMVHIHTINKPKYILGMTATPFRTDSVKLCFDSIIKDCGIGMLIKDGYLSPYHHYTHPRHNPETVASLYLGDQERWGQSIMFFHTIPQCMEARDRLRAGGIQAEVVTGGNSSEREYTLDAFREGKTQVLVNCMVLTEGFDCPSLKTAFLRPSCKSVTIQMAGRAFRKHPETPFKQIVQCKKTRWPFIRTAAPEIQYTQRDDGGWGSLTPNKDLNRLSCKMLMTIATISVDIPDYFKTKKGLRRQRRRRRD